MCGKKHMVLSEDPNSLYFVMYRSDICVYQIKQHYPCSHFYYHWTYRGERNAHLRGLGQPIAHSTQSHTHSPRHRSHRKKMPTWAPWRWKANVLNTKSLCGHLKKCVYSNLCIKNIPPCTMVLICALQVFVWACNSPCVNLLVMCLAGKVNCTRDHTSFTVLFVRSRIHIVSFLFYRC